MYPWGLTQIGGSYLNIMTIKYDLCNHLFNYQMIVPT